MYSLSRCLLKRTNNVIRTFSSEISKSNVEKWDLLAGLEYENSHKSNFEIRLENDLKRMKDLKEGKIDDDTDKVAKQTGQDFLDACNEELKSFNFEKRQGDEKLENNLKSTRRALDRRLLLLIREKIGEKPTWILPQGLYKGEESLRITAERVLQEKCGHSLNARFLGNCPCGYYKYRYPKYARKTAVGAKIFFFKAQLVQGEIDEKICKDFQWATRTELEILPKDYCKTVKKFLIDEEH
ncbi:hypothetical protein O3M35_009374 [Rhynocoris fuscipes]|uniref:Large ribosomal subunit protein mL46 n=1 Tax=Rhynocoris fuscipes TaxID=488301 RepID=A0AAW1D9M3_9HEMI